jgi:hypothetical protein
MTWPIDLQQNVGTSAPVTSFEVRLSNDFDPGFHRINSSPEAALFIEDVFVCEYGMSPIFEIRKVSGLMPKSALLKHGHRRIVPVRFSDFSACRAQIQRGHMATRQVLGQITRGYLELLVLNPHGKFDIVELNQLANCDVSADLSVLEFKEIAGKKANNAACVFRDKSSTHPTGSHPRFRDQGIQ